MQLTTLLRIPRLTSLLVKSGLVVERDFGEGFGDERAQKCLFIDQPKPASDLARGAGEAKRGGHGHGSHDLFGYSRPALTEKFAEHVGA